MITLNPLRPVGIPTPHSVQKAEPKPRGPDFGSVWDWWYGKPAERQAQIRAQNATPEVLRQMVCPNRHFMLLAQGSLTFPDATTAEMIRMIQGLEGVVRRVLYHHWIPDEDILRRITVLIRANQGVEPVPCEIRQEPGSWGFSRAVLKYFGLVINVKQTAILALGLINRHLGRTDALPVFEEVCRARRECPSYDNLNGALPVLEGAARMHELVKSGTLYGQPQSEEFWNSFRLKGNTP